MTNLDQIWNYGVLQMQTNQFFSAAAFSSVLLAIGVGLRRVPIFIWNRIYRKLYFSVTIEQESFLYFYILQYIQLKYPQTLRRVEAKGIHIGEGTTEKEIVYNQENDSNYFWYNKRRLDVHTSKEKLEHAENFANMFNRTYHIGGLFAEKAIKKFINEAMDYGMQLETAKIKAKEKIKVFIGSRDNWSGWSEHLGVVGKSFDSIFLSNKQDILDDLEFFKRERDIYAKLGVPYKRGYVFHGTPGNGKSALAFAIGEYLKYDIYVLSLSDMRDSDLTKAFSRIPPKSIILIEDIDSFYNGREAQGENKVSFSTLLNVLSGVAQKNDIITIFTTNIFESLDPALLRDSRCDFSAEIKNPTKEVVEQYLSYVFEKEITLSFTPNLGFSALQNIVLKHNNDLSKVINILQNEPDKVQLNDSPYPTLLHPLSNKGE